MDDESLALIVDFLWEFGRDGVMSSSVLDNKTLVTFHSLEDVRLFYSPLSNICPFLILLAGTLGVLLSMRRLPSGLPIIGELLEEVGFDDGRLSRAKSATQWRRNLAGDFKGAM